ncbi:MAG: FAD-dependent oxidoreductase [Pseudomonadota bacterium]
MINKDKNLAIIGAGISGMAAAWALSRHHRVSLYEQNSYLGGHSNTVDLALDGDVVPVDTGFIVFNPPNYPYLVSLFNQLGVETVSTGMSFGVSMQGGRLEYAGSNLNGLFAQRSNLLRPRFWQMIGEVKRFYQNAPTYLESAGTQSIGELVQHQGFSKNFMEEHLMPMAGAIWSASRSDIEKYPATAFIRFFANHGLLQLHERPPWQTVKGGSRVYVEKLIADTRFERIIQQRVVNVSRSANGVSISDAAGDTAKYDDVVFACHADEALKLLEKPTSDELKILGAFNYSQNEAVLHEDQTLMPKRKAAWSSWNYIQHEARESTFNDDKRPLCVSYWMNRLQNLSTQHQIFVTLNPSVVPNADKVHGTFHYTHPIFNGATASAQANSLSIQGQHRSWYCGAYLGHGFHEDGIQSGLWVAEQFACKPDWEIADSYPRLPSQYEARQQMAA